MSLGPPMVPPLEAGGSVDPVRAQARLARPAVLSGVLRGAALVQVLEALPLRDRDVWLDELLGLEDAPPEADRLPQGAVPYLPSGVDEILAAVQEAPVRPEDVFVDLGSGLGKVVLLAHLVSGARAVGIEIQQPLELSAQEHARKLGLQRVSFIHANAAEVDLAGTVFFLFAPFNGDLLTAVLRRLETVARRTAIVVCAVGLEFPQVPWLMPRKTSNVAVVLYDSEFPGVPPRARP